MGITPEAVHHLVGIAGAQLLDIEEVTLYPLGGDDPGSDLLLEDRGRLVHDARSGRCYGPARSIVP